MLLLARSAGALTFTAPFAVLLAMPLASGAALCYAILLYVRGRRLTDTLLMAAVTALLAVEIPCGLLAPQSALLPGLVAAQMMLVPVLRSVALRHWQAIDWRVFSSAVRRSGSHRRG